MHFRKGGGGGGSPYRALLHGVSVWSGQCMAGLSRRGGGESLYVAPLCGRSVQGVEGSLYGAYCVVGLSGERTE